MKDRLSKYPGRVKLTPVAGQADTFDMIRADEPEEAGTPINKNSLLRDDTAEAMGLDPATNPTPDDALKKIMEKYEPKVGDVRETMRDDLDDRWILCNGDIVPEGELPELREKLPYNTEYRRIYPIGEYVYFRALPRAGQWFFCETYNARGNVTVAYLYDANTDTWTTINCPNVTTDYYRGIFGLTWDGERYILGVNEDSAAEDYIGNIFLFVSTDLKTWTQKFKTEAMSNSHTGCDLSHDGTNILLMEKDLSYGGLRISYINAAMTKKTSLVSITGSDYNFVTLPNGYWSYKPSDAVGISVYKPGSNSTYFSFSASYGMPNIAFFSDRYWLSLPLDGSNNPYIQVADLTTNEVTRSSVIKLLKAFGYNDFDIGFLMGAEYDRTSDMWMLYLKGEMLSGDDVYFVAYISADAKPDDLTKYTALKRIDALPESMYNVQMAPDGTLLLENDGKLLIRDPNLKYLPSHDGDTYKYIYKGDNET